MRWRLSPDQPWRTDEPGAFARQAPGFEIEQAAPVPGDPVARCAECATPLDRPGPYCRECVEHAFAASPGFVETALQEWMGELVDDGDKVRLKSKGGKYVIKGEILRSQKEKDLWRRYQRQARRPSSEQFSSD